MRELLKAHGGFYEDTWQKGRKTNGDIRMTNADLHNITDDQVIGVVEYDDINSTIRNIVNDNLFGYIKGDNIDYLPLNDGQYLLLRVINAEEYPSRDGESGEFRQLFDKKQERENNKPFRGKHNKYYRWSSKDAEDLAFKNPYYKNWSNAKKEELMKKIKDDYKKQ